MLPFVRSLVVFVLVVVASAASATAGGGVTSGRHTLVGGFSNYDLQATAVGGFGYGAGSRGTRIGGFGLAISSAEGPERLAGGFGGNITGQEFRLGPVTIAITAWTGLGGISATGIPGTGGYFAFLEELDLDVGFAPLPWLQIVGYAGFQLVASILPGFALDEAISYTPTVGLRVVWGDFR